ncbi:MAG TPA: hypothetical protein VII76_14620 [Acidimicrobiales bacterium]
MIPSLHLVEDIPDWGALVEVVGGEHHGARVLLVPAARVLPRVTPAPSRAAGPRHLVRLTHQGLVTAHDSRRAEADRRAEGLLESLLDDDQREQWRSRRRFSVRTPYGIVELGRVSHLRFDDLDGGHLVLCVVPLRSSELPPADIWTNLLLVLRGEPRRFFDVANYCVPGGRWHRGPVPLPHPSPVPPLMATISG